MSINRRAMQMATIGVAIALVAAATLVVTGLTGNDTSGADLLSGSEPLPEGSDLEGRPGAEQSAIELVQFLNAVTLENGDSCPTDRLAVSWAAPAENYENGAHYTPVGPEPGPNTVSANGIVTCNESTFSYTGFAARWNGEQWETDLTPSFFGDDVDGEFEGNTSGATASTDLLSGGDVSAQDLAADDLTADEFAALIDEYAAEEEANGGGNSADGSEPENGTTEDDEADAPAVGNDEGDVASGGLTDDITALEIDPDWEGLWDEDPEDLAAYEPQQICSPSAKPGTQGFKDLVLSAYAISSDFGISRDCGFSPDGTSVSEHYEGRAWDWKVLVAEPQERKAAAEVIGWLLATDEEGNDYAMARRLGVMYMIFNNSIWSSYRAEDGWRGYSGANPHTDHVHFSFDRAGGLGDTTFWDAEGLPELAAGGFGPIGYLPDAGGFTGSGGNGSFFGSTPPPNSSRAEGGNANRIPVIPRQEETNNNNGGGTTSPVPNTPSAPSVPGVPNAPSVPNVPTPTVPNVPGLPLCPPGTPLVPVPTNCILRNTGAGGGGGLL